MKKSETINLNTANNSHKMYDDQIFIEYFYEGYLGKMERKTNEKRGVIFEAESPFGPGKIKILWSGAWYDEATGEMGSMEDFINKMFPLMYHFGAVHTVFAEYFAFRDYYHQIKGEIDLNDELEIVRDLAQKHGRIEYEWINGFRVYTVGIYDNGDVHYTEFHKVTYNDQADSDFRITQNTSYRFDASCTHNFLSFIYGVQKIKEHPNSDCIYFVEDPLQQATLLEHVNEPVYVRPDQESYFHNDYNRLVKGKQVFLAKKVVPGPFEVDKLKFEKFDSDDSVDFFSFYDEEVPQEQDWGKNKLYEPLWVELLSQKFTIAQYLKKQGIEVVRYTG